MPSLDDIPPFISQQDLAKLLGIHVNTVMRWRKRGQIRAFKVGRHWRISKDDVIRFLEQHSNIQETVEDG